MIEAEIKQSVDYAIKTIGLEEFKKTLLFMSNRKEGDGG